jgi:predicted PurR-regulated permease PerM
MVPQNIREPFAPPNGHLTLFAPGTIAGSRSARGLSVVEQALKAAPNFFALLVIVHVLAFFLLTYGARLQKRLVEMIPGLREKQNVVGIASEIEQTAARYFASVTFINAGVGLAFGSQWVCSACLIRYFGALPRSCSIMSHSWLQRAESWR